MELFPAPIENLPKVELGLPGAQVRLSQGADHQILFMEFAQDAILPAHSHEAQWGIVLKGTIELTIDGETKSYEKGDHYFIPAGITHSAKIHAGYADVTFFDAPSRYQAE